jgi:hypothetical protein
MPPRSRCEHASPWTRGLRNGRDFPFGMKSWERTRGDFADGRCGNLPSHWTLDMG